VNAFLRLRESKINLERNDTLKLGERAAKIGFASVALIGVVKGYVGLSTGSVSLTAQAVDSVTDLLALAAVYLGLRISRRSPSDTFPYGYYRLETLASLFTAVLILVTGVELLRESVLRTLDATPIGSPLEATATAGASIPVLLLLSKYVGGIGEEINSKSLQGQAAEFRADALSSALVLLGVVSSQLGFAYADGLVGAFISLIILRVGAGISWEALLVLLDAVSDPEKMIEMREEALKVAGVLGVERARIRRSGPVCMGQLSIFVDERLSVEEGHRISEEVERRIKEAFPEVESLIIQVVPSEREELRITLPILEDRGMESPTTSSFGEAPYFLLVDVEGGSVVRWGTVENPGRGLEKKRGLAASQLLIDEGATMLISGHVGEGPFHFLRGSFIDLYVLPAGLKASESIDMYLAGGLEAMGEPTPEDHDRDSLKEG
jgi:cation diffusion facilitator family transporter